MLSFLDLAIAVVYVAALFTFGVWTGVRETKEDFLILSRHASLPLVLFSIVSSWVGVGTTVATAASAYDKGISLGLTGAIGALIGVCVAGLMARRIKTFGDRFQAHTIGDFLGFRYSERCRLLASALIIVVYLLLCAAQYVGLTGLLVVWAGVPMRGTIIFAALSTILYTAFAGIKSDFYTDGVHFFVLTGVMFAVLVPRSFMRMGAPSAAFRALPHGHWDPFAYGGAGFLFAGIAFGVAGVFVTMEIWQRIFASSSISTARRAMVLGGILIFLFYASSTFLGLVTRILLPALSNKDHALYELMKAVLPTGWLGLGVAAFLGIFVSTVNTMMMVSSASLTKDFYVTKLRPNATDREVLWFGRFSTLLVGIAAYVLAVIIGDLVVLAVNSLFVLLVLLPSILGGFFWRRGTSSAAVWSIIIGVIVIIAALPRYPNAAFAPGFVASAVVYYVTSIFTKHDPQEHLEVVEGPYDLHDGSCFS